MDSRSDRFGRSLQDVFDDGVGVDALGFTLEVEQDAVAQGGQGDVSHVVDGDGVAAVEQRADLAGQEHGLDAGRRRGEGG